MILRNTKEMSLDLVRRGRDDPMWFCVRALDLRPEYIWSGMQDMSDSMRDHEKTAVFAGHGVSKTFTLGRLALAFLYCWYPSTVVTTAPTGTQVKDLLWREIRQAHTSAKVHLGGKLTTTMLDMQPETGQRWFATGFSTRPDTVTQEATAFQGYHNHYLLLLFDEAAGILPEIWRAALHIGSPFKRWLAIGNPTSSTGDFPDCFTDPTWHNLNIAVTDTPNYKQGRMVIPGVYGREYVDEIIRKYGKDSDEYRVRVAGQISRKPAEGAYYFNSIVHMEADGRIGDYPPIPGLPVHTVWDPGYTTAIWFFQVAGEQIRVLRCYEDSGLDIEDYAEYIRKTGQQEGYRYGIHYSPSDVNSNAYKLVARKGLLEGAHKAGLNFMLLGYEASVNDGIDRVKAMFHRVQMDATNCKRGIMALKTYHEKKNKQMSTEDQAVFTGKPEDDWTAHIADGFRYLSKAVQRQGYFSPDDLS